MQNRTAGSSYKEIDARKIKFQLMWRQCDGSSRSNINAEVHRHLSVSGLAFHYKQGSCTYYLIFFKVEHSGSKPCVQFLGLQCIYCYQMQIQRGLRNEASLGHSSSLLYTYT